MKRWQEYTEELYKKGLNDLENHNGVISCLKPDILVSTAPAGKFSAFKRNLHTVFHSGGLIYIPTNSAQAFQLLHILSNICSLLSFW